MKYKKPRLLTLGIIFSMICLANPVNLSAQSKSDSKPIEIDITKALKTKKSFKMSQLVKDVEFVFMESTPECYMITMSEFSFGKNYIMAAFSGLQSNTTHGVHIFDRKGKYLRTLGKEGRGPGEYIPPFKAVMDPSEEFVLIVDANQKKLLTYSIDGEFIQEQKFSKNNSGGLPHPAIDYQGQVYLYFERPHRPIDHFPSIVKYDQALQPVQDILVREKNQDQTLALIRNKFSATPDHMVFWESYWDTVYYINSAGQAQAKYHFNITKNQWPKKYLADYSITRLHFEEFTTVTGIHDLPDHLLIVVRDNGFNYLVHDKTNGETYTMTNPNKCFSSDEIKPGGSIEDDLLGFERLGPGTYIPDQKLFVVRTNPSYMLGGNDIECLKKKKVLFPEKRDFLIDYAQKATGEEGPLLIIMHAK